MKYYLHDTSAFDDEKVAELYKEFGFEGVGLFYVILEKLGKQEKPIKTDVLKFQLKVGKRLSKCWNFIEQIGLIHSNNGETFNKQLLNFSEKYQIKKERTKEKVSEWRKNQANKEIVTSYETICNQPKVNESKVNESKVNISGDEKKSPAAKKNQQDFIDEILIEFCNAYFEINKSKYEIVAIGKERSAAGKILAAYKKQFPQAESEETISGLREYFYKVCAISDKWLKTNMSPSMIVSKFNEIKQILKNGHGNNIDISKLSEAAKQYADEQRAFYAERDKRNASIK